MSIYRLRLKIKGRPTYDVMVNGPIPHIGDEIELGEFGGITAVEGRGRLGDDPPASYWVEAVIHSMRPWSDAKFQLEAIDPPFVVAKSWLNR